MGTKSALLSLLLMFFTTETVYASCQPGRLLSVVQIGFTLKSGRFTEDGACRIDLSNPPPTIANIIDQKFSLCGTDSFFAQLDYATLNVQKNCRFTLKGSFEGGNISANGKIDPGFQYGSGNITIRDGRKRQSGKFDLYGENFSKLSSKIDKLNSRALEINR